MTPILCLMCHYGHCWFVSQYKAPTGPPSLAMSSIAPCGSNILSPHIISCFIYLLLLFSFSHLIRSSRNPFIIVSFRIVRSIDRLLVSSCFVLFQLLFSCFVSFGIFYSIVVEFAPIFRAHSFASFDNVGLVNIVLIVSFRQVGTLSLLFRFVLLWFLFCFVAFDTPLLSGN